MGLGPGTFANVAFVLFASDDLQGQSRGRTFPGPAMP